MDTAALERLVNRLHEIHKEHGEEAWIAALRQASKDFIRAGGEAARVGEKILGAIHPALVWSELEKEVRQESEADQNRLFMEALQAQLPALKSQGQFSAFQATFEAFRAIVNGVLTQNPELEAKGEEALEAGLGVLRMATRITSQLEDVPEAATSPAAAEFKKPPAAFSEYDKKRELLSGLERVTTMDELSVWWTTNRQRIDEVQTPTLRNPLLDAVREKREKLKGGQA